MPEAIPQTFPSPPQAQELPQHPHHLHPLQKAPEPKDTHQQPLQLSQQTLPTPSQSAVAVDQSSSKPDLEAPQQGSLEPEPESIEDEEDEEDDLEEPDAKRQRISTPDAAKEALDDEAVLALAAHNGNPDPFPNE